MCQLIYTILKHLTAFYFGTATDAYKNMLSGSLPIQQRPMADEEEDTDDDVEKQFASALSPRDQ